MRVLHLLGFAYTALCVWALLRTNPEPPGFHGGPGLPLPAGGSGASAWYQAIKPFCNAVEVDVQLRHSPPPPGAAGAGYAAGCLALAGRIDAARATILSLPAAERGYAASFVFNIGHPVADAGDDRAAGPIMELVLEFWPENYMALYHAGMSEYTLGQHTLARRRLAQFLELYSAEDGWRANAIEVLARLRQVER